MEQIAHSDGRLDDLEEDAPGIPVDLVDSRHGEAKLPCSSEGACFGTQSPLRELAVEIRVAVSLREAMLDKAGSVEESAPEDALQQIMRTVTMEIMMTTIMMTMMTMMMTMLLLKLLNMT